MRRLVVAIGLGLGLGLGSACGYTAGMGFAERGVHTVAIDVAGNATFRERLDIRLTRDIAEVLPVHTGLIPASHDAADSELKVTITDVEGLSLVHGGGSQPVREGALIFHVHVVLLDRRTGAVLVDRAVVDRAEFRSPIGENLDTAAREASADLARKIALALEPAF